MQIVAESKVPGGKLVRLKANVTETVQTVNISGDFFLHPEEAIEHIEQALIGLSKTATREEILQRIVNVATVHKVTMLGITAEAIADLMMEVLK